VRSVSSQLAILGRRIPESHAPNTRCKAGRPRERDAGRRTWPKRWSDRYAGVHQAHGVRFTGSYFYAYRRRTRTPHGGLPHFGATRPKRSPPGRSRRGQKCQQVYADGRAHGRIAGRPGLPCRRPSAASWARATSLAPLRRRSRLGMHPDTDCRRKSAVITLRHNWPPCGMHELCMMRRWWPTCARCIQHDAEPAHRQ